MRIDVPGRRWTRLLAGTACAAAVTVGGPAVALAAPGPPPAAAQPVATAQPRTTAQPKNTQPKTGAQSTATAQSTAAARTADAAQRARTAWETHGRPTAMVVPS